MRLDHVAIPIADAARSLAFYGDVLGLPLIETLEGNNWDGRPWLMLMFGLDEGRQLVLVARRGAPPPQPAEPAETRHIAFSEAGPEALAGWRARLASAGVEAWEEDHGAQRSLYFADPDGLVLEITAPPTAAAAADPAALAAARRWIAS